MNQDLLRRYLLGNLSDVRFQEQIEERILRDEEFHLLVESAEDDLVDAYVLAELSPADRRRFERRLSQSPELTERVRVGRALHRAMSDRRPAGERSGGQRRWLAPTAALFALVAAAGWVYEWRRAASLERELSRIHAEEVIDYALSAAPTRSGAAAMPLRLPASASLVRFRVKLSDYYSYYGIRGRLETVEGVEVWGEDLGWNGNHNDPGKAVRQGFLHVPARLLAPGDYLVVVEGINPRGWQRLGTFAVTVVGGHR